MLYSLNAPNDGAYTRARNRRWSILVSLLLLSVCSATQAEQHGNTLTLATAIERSLEQNPLLRVFEFRHKLLDGDSNIANLPPAYELGFGAEDFAGTGDSKGFDGAELSVSLSSILELGDKRLARNNVVDGSRAVLDARQQTEALDLLGEVTRRYVEVLAAQARLTLAQVATRLAEDTLNEVKKRSDAGAVPVAEVQRARAAAGQARLTAASETQQLNYRRVALAELWGERTPSFTSVEGSLYQFGEDREFEALYAKLTQNPAILVFAAEQRLRDAELRLANAQANTDVRWSVGLKQFQETDDTAIMAGFSVPLFSSKRNRGATQSAVAARDEVAVRKEAAMLSLHTQLFHTYSNRQQAILTVKALQSSIIPSLEQALRETQRAYQHGRYSYLDYLTARQELISARRTLIDAASAVLRYGADIEQLTATPLSEVRTNSVEQIQGVSQ
ncbi:TolC family protein [Arenicella xantha]|uniref:Cobalt-zinc-cadmium efflux system outer membrane protein n=1 Tax=Arenicella xantha TaxID=644221 RepID=A0A395JM40_9GAMM|nr:TolC family protein [Arenicella xantha]RBP52680.1 cobalt-zinc-cadmium efflux system outer membrane protein [Arenicella xantha]